MKMSLSLTAVASWGLGWLLIKKETKPPAPNYLMVERLAAVGGRTILTVPNIPFLFGLFVRSRCRGKGNLVLS